MSLEKATKSKGLETRERILAAAETLILERGYSGMTIDDLLAATGLTKGAFFHHFKSKADLAEAVARRYFENDMALFKEFSERADRLSDDPLERVLIFLRLFSEYLDGLGAPFKGCIFASYTYERRQFAPEMLRYIDKSFGFWSSLFEEKLKALINAQPPKIKVTARGLAEMIVTTIEGGFIMANAKNDAKWTQRQLEEFQRYLKLLFV